MDPELEGTSGRNDTLRPRNNLLSLYRAFGSVLYVQRFLSTVVVYGSCFVSRVEQRPASDCVDFAHDLCL